MGMRINSSRDVAIFIVATTTLTILLTETFIGLLYFLGGREAFHVENAIIFGVLVPILICTPITYIMGRMSLALSHTQKDLRELAHTDPLTKLPNRRSFFDDAARSLEQCRITGVHATLLVIDADHFKELNDNYGHLVGDKALSNIADILRENFRHNDFLCRVGGEEFAVLLPDLDTDQAAPLAQRLLEAVCASPLCENNAIIEYSVSCGIADTRSSYDLPTLFKAADDAMYMAKKQGRNRIATFDQAA